MALIVGLLKRLASPGILTSMIVALGLVHLPHGDPFASLSEGRSYELAAIYLACAVLLLLLGYLLPFYLRLAATPGVSALPLGTLSTSGAGTVRTFRYAPAGHGARPQPCC
jgi:hypothetical protein